MQRRELLKQIAVAAALSSAGTLGTVLPTHAAPRSARLRIGVVGGGIVGASIAYHLARAGALVTLFEKAQPASGATQNSFAWLNAFVADRHYRALRLESLRAYHELDRQLGLGIIWGGYMEWAGTESQVRAVHEDADQLAGTPYPVRRIDAAQLGAMAPSLAPGPVTAAFFSHIDGHLHPVEVTRRFLSAAEEHGAMVRLQCEVQALKMQNGTLVGVETGEEQVSLDRLVVASGVDTPKVLALAGFDLKLKHAPGILAHSKPRPIVTPIIFDAPGPLSFKQMADGSIVGTDAEHPPDIPAHREIRDHTVPFPDEALRTMHGERILGKIAAFFPAARGAGLDRLTLGFRPVPLDELPVIGTVPGVQNLYVAVTHSGVTLAPILGRYVTQEVMTGTRVAALAPFRPERFGSVTALVAVK